MRSLRLRAILTSTSGSPSGIARVVGRAESLRSAAGDPDEYIRITLRIAPLSEESPRG